MDAAGPRQAIKVDGHLAVRDRNVLAGPDGDLQLEPKVMDLLFVLAERPDEVVARADLVDRVWGRAHGGDESLTRAVSLLRKALGSGEAIETVAKRGYRLRAHVEPADPPPCPTAPVPAAPGFVPPRRPIRAGTWGAVLLGACAALLLAWVFLPGGVRDGRVAVLAFDTGGDASLLPFADALADQVAGMMSVNGVVVARREGTGGPGTTAALLLDGNVRATDGMLRVDMHVVDTREELVLWAAAYERPGPEAAFLQEQVATHAADILRCAQDLGRAGNVGGDGAALSLFLRACDRVSRFDQGPDDVYETTRQLTERAPSLSRGWSMLAYVGAIARLYAPPERAGRLAAEARAAADKALSLDPRNGAAFLALSVLEPPRRWAEREALVARALEVEPNLADAHNQRARLLLDVGRAGEALAAFRRAAAIEPLAPAHVVAMVPALGAAGFPHEARATTDRLNRVWPNSPTARLNRFKNAAFLGDMDRALAILEAERGRLLPPPAENAWRRLLQAMRPEGLADRQGAAAELDTLARAGGFDMPAAVAALSVLGDLDRAFALAADHLSSPATGTSFLFLPPTEAMRRDPRFPELAGRAGLTEHWSRTGVWPDFCARPDLRYDCDEMVALAP